MASALLGLPILASAYAQQPSGRSSIVAADDTNDCDAAHAAITKLMKELSVECPDELEVSDERIPICRLMRALMLGSTSASRANLTKISDRITTIGIDDELDTFLRMACVLDRLRDWTSAETPSFADVDAPTINRVACLYAWRASRIVQSEAVDTKTVCIAFGRAWKMLAIAALTADVSSISQLKYTLHALEVALLKEVASGKLSSTTLAAIGGEMDAYSWVLEDIEAPMVSRHERGVLSRIDNMGSDTRRAFVRRQAEDYFKKLRSAMDLRQACRNNEVWRLGVLATNDALDAQVPEIYLARGLFSDRRLSGALARQLRYAIAVQQYERAKGALPDQLGQLSPQYISERWLPKTPEVVVIDAKRDAGVVRLMYRGLRDPDFDKPAENIESWTPFIPSEDVDFFVDVRWATDDK